MINVTLHIDVNSTLEIVHELKRQGWVMGADFDFSHHRPEYDDFGHDLKTVQFSDVDNIIMNRSAMICCSSSYNLTVSKSTFYDKIQTKMII